MKLLLNGGKVNDNVFAGGLATLGGKATVEKALVQVNGAEVTGNMYGGVAGSYQNEAFYADYKTASSNVKETTISLINGSLNGDVYAGGFNIKDSTSSKSSPATSLPAQTMTWAARPASRSPAITSLGKSSMVPPPRR